MENKTKTRENSETSKGSNFYKIGFYVLFSFFMLLTGASISWYLLVGKINKNTAPEISHLTPTNTQIPSPTFVITPTEKEINSINNSLMQKSDVEQIREAMATKHGKTTSQTIINVSKNTGTHAVGSVKFEGEIAGGWFLATKLNGKWIIVDDGNGTVSCDTINPYNFPSSIINECVDNNGNLIHR
uniref:Uncharacterized protein n=1 Tax=candidate division CPR3 bacterium TaxID=2268181 RepID=A0A7C4R553_UNCC3